MHDEEESVFDRLWDRVIEPFNFIAPVFIVKQPESLTIVDYRPTLMMFLTALGLLGSVSGFAYFLIKYGFSDSLLLWVTAIPAVVCAALMFRGTIREYYYFDKTNDKYFFNRQFIHRKEVIEGAISQFTGARVKTERNEETNSYYVVLEQEGMFLTGVSEQILREDVPIFNSFSNESRIANAISAYLHSKS